MNREVRNAILLGKKCFENGEYARAEHYIRQVLRVSDRFADLHNMLGLIYHERGKFEKAQQEFERALELNPSYTEAGINLAVVCNDMGRYAEGRLAYMKAAHRTEDRRTGIDPFAKGKLANLHAELGDLYRALEMYDEALAQYHHALDLCYEYVDVWEKLGNTYRDAGRHEESMEAYRKGMEVGRFYAPLRIGLGLTYYTQGRQEEARREWRRVLADDPANERAAMYLRLLEKQASPSLDS